MRYTKGFRGLCLALKCSINAFKFNAVAATKQYLELVKNFKNRYCFVPISSIITSIDNYLQYIGPVIMSPLKKQRCRGDFWEIGIKSFMHRNQFMMPKRPSYLIYSKRQIKRNDGSKVILIPKWVISISISIMFMNFIDLLEL